MSSSTLKPLRSVPGTSSFEWRVKPDVDSAFPTHDVVRHRAGGGWVQNVSLSDLNAAAVGGRRLRRALSAHGPNPSGYSCTCTRNLMPSATQTRRGRPRLLAQDRVVAEARRIAAVEGAEALSMRRLAEALGVMPNTLYTYFSDKAAILDAVLDDLVGDVATPPARRSWRRAALDAMASYRRLLLTQPGLIALTVSRPMVGPNAVRLREDVLTLLRKGGLGDSAAVGAYMSLFAYTTGFVTFEAARPPGENDAEHRSDTRKLHEALPAAEFPTTRALARRLAKRPGDADFEQGLDRLLHGYVVREAG
jgi:AcrR family transcriptional regulator